MGYAHGTQWTEKLIEKRLLKQAKKWGRMPSMTELRHCGATDLACIVSRRGGYRHWRLKLGLDEKQSESSRGTRWERWAARRITENCDVDVQAQTMGAPYDLRVGGSLCVDVKSSQWSEYAHPDGHAVRSFAFTGCKYGRDCDLFLFVCLNPSGNRVRYVFAVPSDRVAVQTVSISQRRIDAWQHWRNAEAYATISRMCA